MSDFIPAPAFRIDVTVFAWTNNQAELIRRQVAAMFTGVDVVVSPNIPPPPPPPQPSPEATIADSVPPAPAAPVPPPPPPPRIVPEGSPVVFDQFLRDLFTGAIVQVTDISDGAFAWQNTDAAAAENAKSGVCSFSDFSVCYEPSDAPPPPVPVPIAPPPPLTPRVVPANSPVTFGQLLRDLNTGAIVKVSDISDSAFVWENTDLAADENAKSGVCPFASFPDSYEDISAAMPMQPAGESAEATAPAAALPQALAPDASPEPAADDDFSAKKNAASPEN